ncbi:hypothetical protein CFC21_046322 [Triticum aestivum]|uniref:Uncharacterized protein n=2 Tax=Triticum aestivum TaxID=4565 RepID=A0A9R1FV61_WHEAT|nr:uncharacterized protein LOC123077501 [Triticum aestivum]KAF7035443.1 hypothetical protein CFC21_046322 [Triticum aestivum]
MNDMARDAYAALSAEKDPLKQKCLKLLLTHDIRGTRSFYQYKAFELVPSRSSVFKIDFEHVLQEGYLDVAIKIWEDNEAGNGFGYLRKTAVDFLKTQCLFEKEVIDVVDIGYDHFPLVMQPFSKYKPEELMKEDNSLFGQSNNLVNARFRGRQIIISAHEHARENHAAGRTWGGHFDASKIYIIEFSCHKIWCRILATTTEFTPANQVLDVKQIHKSMAGQYEINGSSPPHFECLQVDIDGLNANSAVNTSIMEYFPYHVAFMPDGANKHFTEELHNITEGVWMDVDDLKVYNHIFESELTDVSDWRDDYSSLADPVLRGVYNYEHTALEMSQGQRIQQNLAQPQQAQVELVMPQQVQETVRQQFHVGLVQPQQAEYELGMSQQVEPVNQRQQAQVGLVQQIVTTVEGTSEASTSAGKSKRFKRTLKGKLTCKRHLLVHVRSYMVGKRPLVGLFQAETYAAKRNPVLGEIFSLLFKGKTMHLGGHLAPLLVLYRALRDTDEERQVCQVR